MEITARHFAWGVEHAERDDRKDCFVLEYASTVPQADLAALDREAREVFERIRPISELWGLDVANVAACPTASRKGRYFTYLLSREPDGTWSLQREPARVFVNE